MRLAYAQVRFKKNIIHISLQIGNRHESHKVKVGMNRNATLIAFLRHIAKAKNIKIAACSLPKDIDTQLASQLWLELDISPIIDGPAKIEFNGDGSYSAKTDKNNKVITPPLAELIEYEKNTPPEEFQRLLKLTEKFQNKKAIFISATPQGGGVALMRHSMNRIFKQLELDIDWFVLEDDPRIFDITKRKFHNVLQTVAETDVILTDKDKQIFDEWSEVNYRKLKTEIKRAEIIVIDDPQPSGLIPHIRKDFKKRVIYRSHIQLVAKMANKKNTSQNTTWEFIWEKIKSADLFVSHPKKEFVPNEIPKSKLVFMGATTDRLDGLNKPLSISQREYYLQKLTQLDLTRPYITQIARFDPSKGIPDLLESYKLLCGKLSSEKIDPPQLVIAGNSSVDDPDGKPIYEQAMNIINSSDFKHLKDDIKVIRLPHHDQLLNTVLRQSLIALQLSYKEGFEVKVTEALMKGKPVIAYDNGGIPLQIQHKKTGYLVKSGDTKQVAEYLHKLLTDKNLYQKMSFDALNNFNTDANSISNIIYWLENFNKLLK